MDKMDSSVMGACGRAPWECMMASRSGVPYWTSFSMSVRSKMLGVKRCAQCGDPQCGVRCAAGVGYSYWLSRDVKRT